jgi:hypothetical protein
MTALLDDDVRRRLDYDPGVATSTPRHRNPAGVDERDISAPVRPFPAVRSRRARTSRVVNRSCAMIRTWPNYGPFRAVVEVANRHQRAATVSMRCACVNADEWQCSSSVETPCPIGGGVSGIRLIGRAIRRQRRKMLRGPGKRWGSSGGAVRRLTAARVRTCGNPEDPVPAKDFRPPDAPARSRWPADEGSAGCGLCRSSR